MFTDINEFIAELEKRRMLARIGGRPWPKKIATTAPTARKADEMWQKISKGWKL